MKMLKTSSDFERVGSADIVCLTGMSIQGRRLFEIIEDLKARGVMIVVGGPMATVEPGSLEGSPMSFLLAKPMRLGRNS
jgi:hypothetical protein